MQGNYVHKLTASYATHEGQRTARRRSPSGSEAANAAPASTSTAIGSSGGDPPSVTRVPSTQSGNTCRLGETMSSGRSSRLCLE